MIDISKRLKTIADSVPKGSFVIDIGTDHAYMPIYLIKSGICNNVLAMDVNKGPLKRAQENINEYQVEDKISLKLSDGLKALEETKTEVVTISGMGGKLIEKILLEGYEKLSKDTRLILSPQSEIEHFRLFLKENDILLENEIMLEEEGKFYIIFNCLYKGNALKNCEGIPKDSDLDTYSEIMYGRKFDENSKMILKRYLEKEEKNFLKVKQIVMESDSKNRDKRIAELDFEIEAIQCTKKEVGI